MTEKEEDGQMSDSAQPIRIEKKLPRFDFFQLDSIKMRRPTYTGKQRSSVLGLFSDLFQFDLLNGGKKQ